MKLAESLPFLLYASNDFSRYLWSLCVFLGLWKEDAKEWLLTARSGPFILLLGKGTVSGAEGQVGSSNLWLLQLWKSPR